MIERRLRLVVPQNVDCKRTKAFGEHWQKLKEHLNCVLVSKNEKIYILKDILTKIYRDYEITTGIIDEPYFIRAEKKLRRIVREGRVDYYYNLLKKFQSNI